MPSSVIDNLIYHESRSILEIRFLSGSIYEYKDVPKIIYQAMRHARSKGIYFNEHIKGKYTFSRIK